MPEEVLPSSSLVNPNTVITEAELEHSEFLEKLAERLKTIADPKYILGAVDNLLTVEDTLNTKVKEFTVFKNKMAEKFKGLGGDVTTVRTGVETAQNRLEKLERRLDNIEGEIKHALETLQMNQETQGFLSRLLTIVKGETT